MERYSVIRKKRKREIVLLRGSGCAYARCSFCDYFHDFCGDREENFLLNSSVLDRVTGEYGDLEVINSGSVFELDRRTLDLIREISRQKNISTIHFEAHYLYRDKIPRLREDFSDFRLKMKLGLESFDYDLRENVLNKGIKENDPKVISENFEEANFLFGIGGQTVSSMKRDIELGLRYFQRICLNLMCENTTGIKPDKSVLNGFMEELYPEYRDNERIDILINNTDFGVGD
ncbi:MAG: radical SAM protein [Firmicutes bacterium]|nr:radical SAM protein [[Eubacterium] siraeum]MCM1488108.1 radical SAM protein [Bacillota bacterium]